MELLLILFMLNFVTPDFPTLICLPRTGVCAELTEMLWRFILFELVATVPEPEI